MNLIKLNYILDKMNEKNIIQKDDMLIQKKNRSKN